MLYDWQFNRMFADIALITSESVNFSNGDPVLSCCGVVFPQRNEFSDGVTIDEGYYVACYDPTKYISDATTETDGYFVIEYNIPQSNGEIKKLGYNSSHPFFNYPIETVENANYDTYYCCAYSYRGVNYTRNVRIQYSGDGVNTSGLWHVQASSGIAISSAARLCYRPLSETIIPR